jgi:hypothetical protein
MPLILKDPPADWSNSADEFDYEVKDPKMNKQQP